MLKVACEHGNKDIAALLLEAGCDCNAQDDVGERPLYAAAGFGHKEFVPMLFAAGADLNAVNQVSPCADGLSREINVHFSDLS
jgi:ankyrin repeat protein